MADVKFPLPDNSVDVVISNCVINLSGDKPNALHESFRVLPSTDMCRPRRNGRLVSAFVRANKANSQIFSRST